MQIFCTSRSDVSNYCFFIASYFGCISFQAMIKSWIMAFNETVTNNLLMVSGFCIQINYAREANNNFHPTMRTNWWKTRDASEKSTFYINFRAFLTQLRSLTDNFSRIPHPKRSDMYIEALLDQKQFIELKNTIVKIEIFVSKRLKLSYALSFWQNTYFICRSKNDVKIEQVGRCATNE